jgi:hypothetical protein
MSMMGRDQILFVNEALRFMFYAYIFYGQEEPMASYFNSIKLLMSNKQQTQMPRFLEMLTALICFSGSQVLRENALLLLYVHVYQPLWITTKVTKSQMIPNSK